jgi:hypothetical protein
VTKRRDHSTTATTATATVTWTTFLTPQQRLATLVEHGLLDHVVCSPEHRGRNRQTECAGRLEVNYQLKLNRPLDRQFCCRSTIQNFSNYPSLLTVQLRNIRPIGEESARLCERRKERHRRQSVSYRQLTDSLRGGEPARNTLRRSKQRRRQHEERLGVLFHCQMECWLETADVMNFKNGKRKSQFASAALRGVNLRITDRGIQNTATRDNLGTVVRRNSRCLPISSGRSRNIPVTLPPGRAKLAINPALTGSVSKSCATIGIVAVTRLAACTAGGPAAWMSSTLRLPAAPFVLADTDTQ